MSNVKTRVGRFMAGSLLVAGCVSTAAVIPAYAETNLGGVNLGAYCSAAGFDGVRLLENKPWGWKCYIGNNNYGIDMNAACRWQYETSIAYARNTRNDAYGWQCYIP